ncbi:MAG: 3-phosphoshikimate 1-carboxyvinyltransferase [Aureliella sp.]
MKKSVADFASLLPSGPVSGSVRPPGSKSITNRAIVCAALASGTSNLTGVLDSEDTHVMIEAWKSLGVDLQHDTSERTLRVLGTAGQLPSKSGELFIANSGTTIRFLTAALAACQGDFVLDGVPRMRERPIADLINAINQLGSVVTSQNSAAPSCPPVRVQASGLSGGKVEIAGNISSQYLSGIMMASPMAKGDVEIHVTGELVSVPYVEMTAEVMRSFGGQLTMDSDHNMSIRNSGYRAANYQVEPDASAASYFWAAAAITGGQATVEGLSRNSLQGDVGFCDVLERMGCTVDWSEDSITVHGAKQLRGIDVDMADISDTVQTLASVAMFADGATTVRGVAHNRVKETDRISDLATELKRMGASVEEFHDGLRIVPPQKILPAEIETYSDHRMAMSMALVGLRSPGIVIRDPGCTGKTYPGYFEEMAQFANADLIRESSASRRDDSV